MRTETPAEIQRRIDDIVHGERFVRHRSILDRIGDWLERWLRRSRRSEVGQVTGQSWGGPISQIVLYVVLALLLVALVYLVVRMLRHGTPLRRPRRARLAPTEVETARPASAWRSEAERHEARGEWKEAIRCRYRELVATLVARGVVESDRGRTTGELRADLSESRPAAAAPFDAASALFEEPWYGGRPTGEEQNIRFRHLADDVLDVTSGKDAPIGAGVQSVTGEAGR
ncbi:MAG: DUF4129 domain-containing protein [Microthrixaceae bacterium]